MASRAARLGCLLLLACIAGWPAGAATGPAQPRTETVSAQSHLISVRGGAAGNRSGAGMYGTWITPSGSGASTSRSVAINWYLQTPVAPPGGLYDVIFYSNAAAGQTFQCSALAVQEGHVAPSGDFVPSATVTRRARLACGAGALAVRLSPVPGGLAARLVIPTRISGGHAWYEAEGVLSMAGRADIHVSAPPLRVTPTPQPPPSSPVATPSASTPSSRSQGSSPSASPSISVPVGNPLGTGEHEATVHLGPAGVVVLVTSVALGVVMIGAGLSANGRRRS